MTRAKLFTPFQVGDLELANRIVIAPMCQYSARNGCMTDWHLIHLGHLALSGAALLTIEATAVVPEGRITYADVGLWSDERRRDARTLESVRRWSDMPIAIQLAHAGRKASTEVPWEGGRQIAARSAERLADRSAVGDPVRAGESAPVALDRDGLARVRERVCRGGTACGAARHRCRAGPRGPRLSAAPVPLAAVEPARATSMAAAWRTGCASRSRCSMPCGLRSRANGR